ncbi:hypothetical protein [Sinosporangium siamense]|uniref:hypothetical protein n=1 Tax=Sinosporangium siamense TaxID=1367973 RepID=UPI001950333D|nr:hypothetical protein [Sinosporangium siamense]
MNSSSVWTRLISLGERAPKAGDGLSAELLTSLATGDSGPGPFEFRHFQPLPAGTFPHVERGFSVDQTNHSVVVGEVVVVKWLTPPLPLPQPGPAMLAHLAEVGFTATAPPYAALIRRAPAHPAAPGYGGAGGTLVALVTGYLPDARDGWEWCVDEAAAGRSGFAAELGVLTADLHVALATPSSSLPVPVRHGPDGERVDEWARAVHTRAEGALAEALALTGGDDGAWLAARAEALRAGLAPLAGATCPPLIRIHGDLHAGQILRWRNGYAVIDFDGNPTVAAGDHFQPAARDLAQLGTSLEHVAQVAIRRKGTPRDDAARWAAAARDGLLAAYTSRLAGRCHSYLFDRSLLRPFAIEQECRELIYAARHLPRWRYAPMGVLRTWYPKESSP